MDSKEGVGVYEIEYTRRNVQGILERFHRFQTTKQRGNIDAIITIIDITRAVKKCTFTKKQAEIFKLLFMREYTIEEVCSTLNIAKSTVAQHKQQIVAKVYRALIGGVTQ